MRVPVLLPGTNWFVITDDGTEHPLIAWVVLDPTTGTGHVLISDGRGGVMRPEALGVGFTVAHEHDVIGDDTPTPNYDPPPEGDE